MRTLTPDLTPPEPAVDQRLAESLKEALAQYGKGLDRMNGKDADLDRGGQLSITDVRVVDGKIGEKILWLVIDLHQYATHVPPDESEIYQQIILGSGYSGEWTGDDWCHTNDEVVYLPVDLDRVELGRTTQKLTAKVWRAIRKAAEPFENAMAEITDSFEVAAAQAEDEKETV